MIDEDRTTIDVIAGSDKKIQPHILLVSETPELLNKIEELQKRSQEQFKTIIGNYDREAQSVFYEIARYPNLITDLVTHGRPSESEVVRIVSNYPQDIREITIANAGKYFDVLMQIERLNNEIDHAFQNALQSYSPQTGASVNVLLGYPEIVSALVNDKSFTALLGEVYREDPEWLNNRINLISQELSERNKEDLNAYKTQIQKDPQAYNEMLDASEKFAREKNEVRYLDGYSEPIVETTVINSYPYWFGYPYWYSDPYWRPRPLYYHTGIYRNQYGNVEIMGLPSGFFLHWNSEFHPRMYPHLSYNYYNFYENHYMKRYHESPHSFPSQGFYRSIENHVINNPNVNNRALRRVDREQGNNIVRSPNINVSMTNVRSSGVINRSAATYNARQNINPGGTNVPGRIEQQNGGSQGRSNQRQFNTINPGRSEGNVIQRNAGSGGSPAQRDARVVPGQQYNNNAPVQQNTRPAQQYTRPAPTQQYNRPAGTQQYNNRTAPVQQYNNRTAPVQQNYRAAPAQQNNNSGQGKAQQQQQQQQSKSTNDPRKEKENRRDR